MEEVYTGDEMDTKTTLGLIYYRFLQIYSSIFIFFMYFGYVIFYASFIFIHKLYPIYILYVLWMFVDRNTPETTRGKWNFARKLNLWKVRRDYFNLKLVKTADIPADRTYLFAGFPHGIHFFGGSLSLMTDAVDFYKAFPGLEAYAATMKVLTNSPISREFHRALGYVSVTEKGILSVLNGPPGNVCGILPGGMAEMNLCKPGENRVVLKNRKGFVRVALKAGASLVPAYTFNETATFEATHAPWKMRLYKILKDKFGVTISLLRFPSVKGRSFLSEKTTGIFPHAVPLATIVGKPINVPKVEHPTTALIDEYHKKFTVELQILFDKYKGKYDLLGERATLVIE